MGQWRVHEIPCAALLLVASIVPAAAQSPSIALPGSGLFLTGGHNSPATFPDYFVEPWHSFQSPASPPEASDASFDMVLAAVEAAQVQNYA